MAVGDQLNVTWLGFLYLDLHTNLSLNLLTTTEDRHADKWQHRRAYPVVKVTGGKGGGLSPTCSGLGPLPRFEPPT